MITQVSNVMATDGVGNPFTMIWEAITGLESRVETLEDRVEALEDQQSLPQGFISAPAYDSGWVSIAPAQYLTLSHNLNTVEVFVYLLGRNESGGIHQITHEMYGVQIWSLDDSDITLWRHGLDYIYWHQVRVMIWKISEPPT